MRRELKCSAVRAAEAHKIGMDFSQVTMDMAWPKEKQRLPLPRMLLKEGTETE